MSDWPTTTIDWRGIRVGDKVDLVPASQSPTGQEAYVVTRGPERTRVTWDPKSAMMAERHLLHWARAGECTKTLAEARRKAALSGRGA